MQKQKPEHNPYKMWPSASKGNMIVKCQYVVDQGSDGDNDDDADDDDDDDDDEDQGGAGYGVLLCSPQHRHKIVCCWLCCYVHSCNVKL